MAACRLSLVLRSEGHSPVAVCGLLIAVVSTLLQYSSLENPMGGRTWWATVHGVAESDTTEQLTLTQLGSINAGIH